MRAGASLLVQESVNNKHTSRRNKLAHEIYMHFKEAFYDLQEDLSAHQSELIHFLTKNNYSDINILFNVNQGISSAS